MFGVDADGELGRGRRGEAGAGRRRNLRCGADQFLFPAKRDDCLPAFLLCNGGKRSQGDTGIPLVVVSSDLLSEGIAGRFSDAYAFLLLVAAGMFLLLPSSLPPSTLSGISPSAPRLSY